MTVVATDPFVAPDEIARRGAEPVSLTSLLQRADVISLHCPLDASTRGLMGAPQFASMKAGALFITTARGGIHDEAALLNALTSGHLGGAGIDVWAVEPPVPNHPLLGLDNVLATQHTAGVTHCSRRQMATMAASHIVALAVVPARRDSSTRRCGRSSHRGLNGCWAGRYLRVEVRTQRLRFSNESRPIPAHLRFPQSPDQVRRGTMSGSPLCIALW